MFAAFNKETNGHPDPSALQKILDIQRESAEVLNDRLLQLQKTMSEANEIHRQQLYTLQQIHEKEKLELTCTGGVVPIAKSSAEVPSETREQHTPQTPCSRTLAMPVENQSRPQHVVPTQISAPILVHKHDSCKGEPMKFVRTFLFTWGIEPSGRKRLLAYNFDRLNSPFAISAIFSSPSIMIHRYSLCVQLLAHAVLATVCYISALVVYPVDKRHGVAFEDTPGGSALRLINDALQRLVPFLLGLFISLQLSRWWTIRCQYLHKIHVCSASLAMNLGLVLPGKGKRIRKRIERYLLVAHEIVFLCGRFKQIDLNFIKDDKIMTEKEIGQLRDSLCRGAGAMQGQSGVGIYDMAAAQLPVMWTTQLLFHLFYSCKESDTIRFPINLLMQMLSQCTEIKNAIHGIEMMLNSPLPFQYVHMVVLVVQFSVLVTSVETGYHMGVLKKKGDLNWLAVVFRIGSMLILNGLYLGLLCLVTVLMHPFRDDLASFPFANMQCRMRDMQIISHDLRLDSDEIDATISSVLRSEEECVPKKEEGSRDHEDVEIDPDAPE